MRLGRIFGAGFAVLALIVLFGAQFNPFLFMQPWMQMPLVLGLVLGPAVYRLLKYRLGLEGFGKRERFIDRSVD
ncbi:MAG: hypothetical protein AAFR41_03110 [Pseudomonadota bacterium]